MATFQPQKVLSAASTINTAGTREYGGIAQRIHTLTVVAGAGVSAGVVALELSQDGTNWVAESSNTLTTSAPGTSSVHLVDKVYAFARARISTAITGGTVDAYLASAS